MWVKEEKGFSTYLISEFSPRTDTVTANSIPAFSWNIWRFREPEVSFIQYFKAVCFVKDGRVFSCFFSVIAPNSYVSVIP